MIFLIYFLLFVSVSSCNPRLRAYTSWSNNAWGREGPGMPVMYDLDVVLNNTEVVTINPFISSPYLSKIEQWHDEGRLIQCYISVGTVDNVTMGTELNEWLELILDDSEDQLLNITKMEQILPLMYNRFEMLKELGCDIIEPDKIDFFYMCYTNTTTKDQAKQLTIQYVLALSEIAHDLDMSIVLKNSLEIIPQVHTEFDGLVIENCQKYNECEIATEYFIENNKAVFSVEYNNRFSGSLSTCEKFPDGFSGKIITGGRRFKNATWFTC